VAVSVVVPLFGEEGNVETLRRRLTPALRSLGRTHEVILVDDGSRDRTLEMLLAWRREDPAVRVLSFARNFGQHAAVAAGFGAARGDVVVTLDADLQNPPEEIRRIVEAFEAGHDFVGSYRLDRKDSAFRLWASALANRTTCWLAGIRIRDLGCMLRGYSREIAAAIAGRPEPGTYIPALGYILARNPTEVPVAHEERHAGRSNYSLPRLLRLHLDLVTSLSVSPLRLLFLAGIAVASLGILFGVALLVLRLWFGATWAAEGVFTLFAILFILIGAQFFAFGLLGEYVGRILVTIRGRPTFLLRDLDGPPAGNPPRDGAGPGPGAGGG
jgi:undecaprenyl-phosphate 4-deoxy-4-formamido-L-arabinose transferase